MSNKTPRILLVDDEGAHIELIRRAFQSYSEAVELVVAHSMQSAREQLSQFNPDAAIVDLNLPDGMGTELLSASPDFARCPVIVMTARGNEQAAVEAIKAGALDYIVKSIAAFAELPRTVSRAIREWEQVKTRREAEANLRRSEARLREAQHLAHIGNWEYDLETEEFIGSAELYHIFGLDERESAKRRENFLKYIHPEDIDRIRNAYKETLENDAPYVFDYRILRAEGEVRHLRCTGRLERDPEGKLVRMFGVDHDITERVQMGEQLEESTDRFRKLVENAPIGIFVVQDDRFVYANPAILKIFGATSEQDLAGKDPKEFVHPDSLSLIEDWINYIQTTGQTPAPTYHKIVRLDGNVLHVYGSPNLITFNGRPAMQVIIHDVTERRQSELALRESEERYNIAVNGAGVGIWDWDLVTNQIYVSPRFKLLLGYDGEDAQGFTGTDYLNSIHPEDIEFVQKILDRHFEMHTPYEAECRVRTKNGDYRWCLICGCAVWDESGQPVRMAGSLADITDRKRVEEAFRESEERFRIAFENAPIGMVLLSPQGVFQQVNFEFTRILGYSREEIIGKSYKEFTIEEDIASSMEVVKTAEESASRKITLMKRYLHKNGSVVWTQVNTYLQRDLHGKPQFFISQIVDISDRRFAEEEHERLEAQLRQAQKLETIGTLAGGIAHDFNNILTPILGYTDMLLAELDEKSPAREDLEHVISAANRAKDLVKQILTFSRQGEHERRPMEPQLIVKEAMKLLRASLPSTVEIRLKITAETETVLADPSQIHQVLMNLCTNAYHAMRSNGGVLEVGLDAVELDDSVEGNHTNLYAGKYVCLMVSDTGDGMDKATLERIFEPFFTTKPVGEGTGLGLPVVHGIVMSHGGDITVYSEPGKGTTFKVFLPCATEQAVAYPEQEQQDLDGTGVILLVDDDKDIIQMGKKILEKQGFKVDAYSSSSEALEAFRRAPDEYDVVVTDQTMPELTGLELTGEIHKIRQDFPVVLMTGFSDTATSETVKNFGVREYVTKPLITRDFIAALKRAMQTSIEDPAE